MEENLADDLQDRTHWRESLVPLPVWKRKLQKHAKRKASVSADKADKRQKINGSSPKPEERRVRLISDADEDELDRQVVFLSDSESGFCLASSAQELDSTGTVWSQIHSLELKEPESSEEIMEEIMDLVKNR